jgi:hypothetical protein
LVLIRSWIEGVAARQPAGDCSQSLLSFKEESKFIQGLVKKAGFSLQEEGQVFSGNISRLLGI